MADKIDKYYDGISQGYDELHREEQEKKLAIIRQYIKPKKAEILLDIGCGTSISSDFDCVCYGIDPSQGLLDIAKDKYPDKTFIQASAEKLPFKEGYFDYIISLTAAQNFENLEKALSEINRVAKPSCKIVISILKKSSKAEKLKQLLNGYGVIEEAKDLIFISN